MSLYFSLRSLLNRLHDDLVKIGGSVEAAAAEYKSENGKEKPAPVVTSVLHRPKPEIEEENARHARHTARDRVRLAVECLALVVGAVVAFANVQLWIQTRESTRIAGIAAKAAQEGAKASADQSEATKQSIQATVNSFQLDQRAWVALGDIVFTAKTTEPIKVTIVVKNVGRTPAMDVISVIGLAEKPKGREIALTDIKYPGNPSYFGALYPSVSTLIGKNLERTTPTQAADIENWKSGATIVYIFARVTYKDVFNEPHWAHFCAQIQNDLASVHACQIYNDIDRGDK